MLKDYGSHAGDRLVGIHGAWLATNPHASGKPFAALEHVVNVSDIYVMHE